jgi:hypothetical protein
MSQDSNQKVVYKSSAFPSFGSVMVGVTAMLGFMYLQEQRLSEVVQVAQSAEMAAVAAQNDRISEGKASYTAGRWCIIAADINVSPELFDRLSSSCAKQHKNWLESKKKISEVHTAINPSK